MSVDAWPAPELGDGNARDGLEELERIRQAREPFELLPYGGLCLYEDERELLEHYRSATSSDPVRLARTIDAIETLGRLRRRRLEELG